MTTRRQQPYSGKVKSFSATKGFGFIKMRDTGEEVYVHKSAIIGRPGFRALKAGQTVLFDVTDEHGHQASNVTVAAVDTAIA